MKRFQGFAAFGAGMLLAMSLLASCSGEGQDDESGVKYRQEGNRITATLGERLTVDAELVGMPESDAAAVLQAKWDDSMDPETVEEVLFPGETDLNEYVSDGFDSVNIYGADGSFRMTYDPTSYFITYNAPELNEKLYESLAKQQDSYNKRWDTVEELNEVDDVELEGYSKEQAIFDVREKLEQMGLQIEEEPYAIYGLNAETLQMLYDREKESGLLDALPEEYQNVTYEKEDEIYQMLWHLQLEDTPIIPRNYAETNNYETTVCESVSRGCLVDVIVTREKILGLRCWGQYKPESVGEEESLISIGEVLASVQDFYSAKKLLRDKKVEKISYCYIPVAQGDVNLETGMIAVDKDTEYTIIPGWCIEVSRDPLPYESIYWDVLCVNGITGEIIP